MIYFATRQQARNFAKGNKKVIDLQKSSNLVTVFNTAAGISKRWGVKVI